MFISVGRIEGVDDGIGCPSGEVLGVQAAINNAMLVNNNKDLFLRFIISFSFN